LSDRTDAHMNDLVSGCGCSRAGATEVVAEVPAYACVAHNARFSSADESVPGNVMIGTCNCNCNFDMNMFLRNVENSVSKILTEKEMVYHQRLEEMENRLRGGHGRDGDLQRLASGYPCK
jgi:hypothetical protein